MKLINSHVHSTASDGKLAPEEVVKEAIKSGIGYLCFCDHYRRPEEFYKKRKKKGSASKFDYEGYVQEVKNLEKKYSNKIEIAFGTEFDWFEEFEDWITEEVEKYRKRYDLIIGSIHYLEIDGEYFPIDATKELWEEISKKIGIENLVKEYYRQVRLMIKSRLFDCVGHLDLIKIYNKDSELFDENAEWYRDAIFETLDVAKEAGICIEVNTHGFVKGIGEQYPSEWILGEIKKRKIPITTSTDAHREGEIDDKLKEMMKLAKKIGFKSIVKFKGHKMEEVMM